MPHKTIDPATALTERKLEQKLRTLKSVVPLNAAALLCDGKLYANFSSNDYLGLSQHPLLKERAIQFISRYGVGIGAARLVSGNHEIHESIEKRIAKGKGTESALIFASGYQLNLTVLSTLANISDSFICDRLVHNSLLLGAISGKARFHRFRHNDPLALKDKLGELKGLDASGWVVTESVFGMDGDISDLAAYHSLTKQTDFNLFVDEAHATGVFGEQGMGLAKSTSTGQIIMGTFGKGCGSFGAYLACSEEMRDYLINFCPGFIYTTALPPPVLGAIDAALDLLPTLNKERQYLQDLAKHARTGLSSLGFDVGNSASQIVPIIVGSDEKALSLAAHLLQNEIFAPAIRPPTVPPHKARVRLSLSAVHNEAHIEKLLNALKHWRPHN